jgi:hypothetical protein
MPYIDSSRLSSSVPPTKKQSHPITCDAERVMMA